MVQLLQSAPRLNGGRVGSGIDAAPSATEHAHLCTVHAVLVLLAVTDQVSK
jgi:hypothetical protein